MIDNMRAYYQTVRNLLARATPAGGFTLLETLVAVLILVTAITGPLTIAGKGLQTALVAKDQTVAYYLAQDAVEYVRFARDTNTLGGGNWLTGTGSGSTDLAPCVSADGSAVCYLDTLSQNPSAPTACPSGSCPALNFYKDPTTQVGNFTYSTGANTTGTIFKRTVSITTPVGTNSGEAQLTVKVYWQDTGANTHPPVTLQESIFNWQ